MTKSMARQFGNHAVPSRQMRAVIRHGHSHRKCFDTGLTVCERNAEPAFKHAWMDGWMDGWIESMIASSLNSPSPPRLSHDLHLCSDPAPPSLQVVDARPDMSNVSAPPMMEWMKSSDAVTWLTQSLVPLIVILLAPMIYTTMHWWLDYARLKGQDDDDEQQQQHYRLKLPPLVGGLPLIGNALDFWARPFHLIETCQRRLGDIFTLHIFGQRLTVLCHPSLCKVRASLVVVVVV